MYLCCGKGPNIRKKGGSMVLKPSVMSDLWTECDIAKGYGEYSTCDKR